MTPQGAKSALDRNAAGDAMQSALSRLSEWVTNQGADVPYEVLMAAFEGRTAVDSWTEVRRGDAR